MFPGTVVAKGCVGACGQNQTLEFTVNSHYNKLMLVKTSETSLCPNTGAFAFLFVNGAEVAHGNITEKNKSIQCEVANGDKVVTYVTSYPLFNGITCIQLGELHFNLIEHDLV